MTWDRARFAVAEGSKAGLASAAEYLLDESTKVAPFEMDTLIMTAAVSFAATGLTAAVSYDTPYAVIQHENLREQHDPGRQGKYLEGPLSSGAPEMFRSMADGIRQKTGG